MIASQRCSSACQHAVQLSLVSIMATGRPLNTPEIVMCSPCLLFLRCAVHCYQLMALVLLRD